MKIEYPRIFVLLLLISLSIFVAEGAIMYILHRLPPFHPRAEGLIDALLLVVVILPVLYVFFFRPMHREILDHKQAREELQKAKDELERRIKERTAELVKANKALQESEEKYRNIFENAIEGIYQTTIEGRYLTANPMLAKLYGYESPEELMASITDLNKQFYVDPNRRDEFIRIMQEKGYVSEFESQVYRRDGSIIWILENVRAIYDTNNKLVGFEGTTVDITERKQAEESLRLSEKKYRILSKQLADVNSMKDLLLDVITHDLKNPAGVIQGMSDMMLMKNPDDEMVQIIKDSSDSLLNVINNATTLSRVTVGEEIEKETLDLSKLVAKVAKEFDPLLQDTGMTLENRLSEPLPVEANPILAEVFGNYISNAIRYAQEGKKIVIEAVEDSNSIILAVKDFGKTIAEEDYERIFKRSIQLEKGEKRGRGLGLAIVKRIAEAHGGEVWVEANKPKGNIFYLKIPIASDQSSVTTRRRSPKNEGSVIGEKPKPDRRPVPSARNGNHRRD